MASHVDHKSAKKSARAMVLRKRRDGVVLWASSNPLKRNANSRLKKRRERNPEREAKLQTFFSKNARMNRKIGGGSNTQAGQHESRRRMMEQTPRIQRAARACISIWIIRRLKASSKAETRLPPPRRFQTIHHWSGESIPSVAKITVRHLQQIESLL